MGDLADLELAEVVLRCLSNSSSSNSHGGQVLPTLPVEDVEEVLGSEAEQILTSSYPNSPKNEEFLNLENDVPYEHTSAMYNVGKIGQVTIASVSPASVCPSRRTKRLLDELQMGQKKRPRKNKAGQDYEQEFGAFEDAKFADRRHMVDALGSRLRNYEEVISVDMVQKLLHFHRTNEIPSEAMEWAEYIFGAVWYSFSYFKEFKVLGGVQQSMEPFSNEMPQGIPAQYELLVKKMTRENSKFKGKDFGPIKGVLEQEMGEKYGWNDDKISRKCPQWASKKCLAMALLTRHLLTPTAAKWADIQLEKFWKLIFDIPGLPPVPE